MQGMDAEIEGLRAAVSRHFSVNQILVNPFAVTFTVSVDPARLDASFDALRRDLVPRNYVPALATEAGSLVIHVQRRPEQRFRGTQVNLVLLLATIATTWIAGAANWAAYADVPLASLESFGLGFASFTVPLLVILGAHEMGHYVMAKRHGVRASLPFFIPSFPILGTFGAFISMRDPIPNRKALLEIGIAGPLVGFALSVPIALLGLALGAGDARPPLLDGGGEITMPSLLYGWMQGLFPESAVDPFRRHPTAFAGWVGLFVTAINLLPAGQLDGGHVARALLGDKHRYFSWGAVLLLLGLGVLYTGWFLFALIILLLGVRHPPPLNDLTRLTPSRRALGVAAIVILVLTFVPAPFIEVPSAAAFQFETNGSPPVAVDRIDVTIPNGTNSVLSLRLNNTGNVPLSVNVTIYPQNLDSFGWVFRIEDYTVFGRSGSSTVTVGTLSADIPLNATEYAVVRVFVGVPVVVPREYVFGIFGEDVAARAFDDVSVHVDVT